MVVKCKKYPMVIVHYRGRKPTKHFFDHKETALMFRSSVNKSKRKYPKESVTKALYKGKQCYR